jgi:hypothetical protein
MTNLNIGSSRNFIPKAKFNSKSGDWSIRDESGTEKIDKPTFIADCPKIRTGWQRYRENQAPERVIDPTLDRRAPCPGEDFKRCFVLSVYSQIFFNGLAELSSTSIHMGDAVREIYQAYEKDVDAHPDELPVLTCTGSEEMQDKYGVNYKPTLELVRWVKRPAEMPDKNPVEDFEVWQGEASANHQADGEPLQQMGSPTNPTSSDIRPSDNNDIDIDF